MIEHLFIRIMLTWFDLNCCILIQNGRTSTEWIVTIVGVQLGGSNSFVEAKEKHHSWFRRWRYIYLHAVLLAEIISHYFPKLVELHNYISTTSAATKLANWNTLNSTNHYTQKRCSKSSIIKSVKMTSSTSLPPLLI